MTDVKTRFALVANGDSHITQYVPEVIDLIIKGEQIVIAGLIESEDIVISLQEEFEAGNIEIELISDETTLAMKGYFAIYETLI